MIKVVLFDMYETLITHYRSPLCFSQQLAEMAGIPQEDFFRGWAPLEEARSTGHVTLEENLTMILRDNGCYSEALLSQMVSARKEVKRDCFHQLHSEILPMLNALRDHGLKLGIVSNCYSEEAEAIRASGLFPLFDAAWLSWEKGMVKPNPAMFLGCAEELGVCPEECIFVGDGGSQELEASSALGMTALQALWYLRHTPRWPQGRLEDFPGIESPSGVEAFFLQKEKERQIRDGSV